LAAAAASTISNSTTRAIDQIHSASVGLYWRFY
jgi:hypothetical protein